MKVLPAHLDIDWHSAGVGGTEGGRPRPDPLAIVGILGQTDHASGHSAQRGPGRKDSLFLEG
jgi:hypothetical protein